jgi:hypothetical protein
LHESVDVGGVYLFAGPVNGDVAAEVLGEPECEVFEEVLPAFRDYANFRVGRPKGPLARTIADLHPTLAHVLEAAGAGILVIEVGDQLAQDPGLIGIGDPTEAMLQYRFGDDSPPGQVVHLHAAGLASVDGNRRLVRAGRDLVRDRQQAVEVVVARHREIAADLLAGEFGVAGLHLH